MFRKSLGTPVLRFLHTACLRMQKRNEQWTMQNSLRGQVRAYSLNSLRNENLWFEYRNRSNQIFKWVNCCLKIKLLLVVLLVLPFYKWRIASYYSERHHIAPWCPCAAWKAVRLRFFVRSMTPVFRMLYVGREVTVEYFFGGKGNHLPT